MDISKLKILDMMQTNLGYLNQRQEVLSQNIANANVPGYQAKDVKGPDFASMMTSSASSGSVKLAVTEPGHISMSGSGKFGSKPEAIKQGDISPTGNSVILENEVLKMSKTGLEYQQTADMYRKMLELIKTAIGNG